MRDSKYQLLRLTLLWLVLSLVLPKNLHSQPCLFLRAFLSLDLALALDNKLREAKGIKEGKKRNKENKFCA